MKELKRILRAMDAPNCDNEITLQRLLRELTAAARKAVGDHEELVACLKANAVEVDYQGEYVFGDGQPEPEKRLAVLPGDIANLEKL